MSELVLFLGSGVSLKSGMPNVQKLSKAIHDNIGQSSDIGAFLEVLQEKVHQHSSRFGQEYIPTYEDLYAFSDYVFRARRRFVEDLPFMPFVDEVAEYFSTKVGRKVSAAPVAHVLSSIDSIHDVAHLTMRHITAVIADALRMRNGVQGLDLIVALAKRDDVDRLHIITTNHDMLIETLLYTEEIPYVDGFGLPDGDVRWFDIASYDSSDVKVLIYKVHGSVNWKQFRDANSRFRMAISLDDRTESAVFHDANGNQLNFEDEQFLSGFNKDDRYHFGIYAELHDRFHSVLNRHDLILMSGYGWNDKVLNLRLLTWLDQSPTNRVVIMHCDQRRILIQSRGGQLTNLKDYYEGGQVVFIPKWMSDTSIGDLQSWLAPNR